MPPDPAEILRRVRAAFQAEYPEQIAVIRAMLLKWPDPDDHARAEAFRMAHSMKGGARVCDLGAVEEQTHHLESILSDIDKKTRTPDDATRQEIEKLLAQVEALMTEKERPTASPKANKEVLRIDSGHLDRLLQSSGQLVTEAVRQEALQRELRDFSRAMTQFGADSLPESHRSEWRALENQFRKIRTIQYQSGRSVRLVAEQFHTEIRHLRMVTVRSVFEGFPKMINDLATEQRKQVRLEMTGLESQADRSVLQALKDAVMHGLRNAVAHGIEMPGERVAQGKQEFGTVRLSAEVSAHHLIVRITDDGRGLNLAAIRSRALDNGLLAHEEIEELSPEEILDVVFRPGFSTASEVTRISGRGVGLSVVREFSMQFQGTTRMRALPSGGAELEIQVPVSISTHRLLLVESAGRTFALPVRSIRSLERVTQTHSLEGRSIILHQTKPIPLATLASAAGAATGLVRGDDGHLRIAILHNENRTVALNVEKFVGEVNALIKPLPHPASLSPHFAGGVILEDGRVALVLNINTLLNAHRGDVIPEEKSKASQAPRRPVVLVVDDSFTARTLQKSILDTAGYSVRIAVDGVGALSILRSETVDAVVSDIQMPEMDGFQLLEAMKNHVKLAEIPVILVTSLNSKEDQERGLSLGASAYIVKERFDHRELLETISQLV